MAELQVGQELIGREEELDHIRSLVGRTSSGSGGALLVDGRAGIGKSALLRYVARMARTGGVPDVAEVAVSYVVSAEAEREWPYSGLHLVLSAMKGAVGAHCHGDVSRRMQGFLGGLSPSLTTYDVAMRLQSLIGEVSFPVLVLVDDAHLLDARSHEVLGFVLRRLRSAPVVAVLGVDDADTVESFRGLSTMHLTELATLDAVRLVQRMGGRSTRFRVAERIVAMAGGNPRVLLDAVGRIHEVQLSGHAELDRYLPSSPVLRAMFLDQIDQLDASRRMALLVAAASADRRLGPVARALGADDTALAWLLREHLQHADDAFVLRQPALRSVIWHVATDEEQRHAHERLAAAYAEDGDDQHLWHVARTRHQEDEELGHRLHQAALRAMEHGELERSLAFSREAVRLTPVSSARVERLITSGRLALVTGRLDETVHMSRERFTRDMSVEQRADLALLEVRARNLLDGDVATGLITRHVEEVEDVDPNRAARLNLFGAVGFAWRMEEAEATRFLNQSGRYREHFDEVTDLIYQRTAAWIASIAGDPSRATSLLRPTPAPVNALVEVEASICHAMALVRAEEFDEARQLLQAITLDGRFDEAPLLLGAAYSVMTQLEIRAGRLLAAKEAASAWHRTGTDGVWRAIVPAHMIRAYAFLGDHDQAWECRRQAVESSRRHGDWWASALVQGETGTLLLMMGQLEQAVSVLERAQRYALEHIDPSILPVEPEYIEACVRLGDLSRAEAALADFRERVSKAPSAWAQHMLMRCEALVAEGEASIELFQKAVDSHSSAVSPVELARTLLCYGERLRRLGRKVDAAKWLHRAIVVAGECDADALTARAEEELRAAGRAPSSDVEQTNELTEAEQRVAALVAAGKRNREIAAELFVSVRTVETHLGRIFRKLGIRSRTELAGRIVVSDETREDDGG